MKKRTKEQKEQHLSFIANLEVKKPSLALDETAFISFISKKLHISKSQAKKDIDEITLRKKELSLIDLKAELAKKKEEYAFIKEQAIKTKNLNAYLGAVNKESEMLALERFAIFSEMQQSKPQEEDNTLEEKKTLLFNKIIENKKDD